MNKPSIPWAKLAVEMFVIVFSVLLALILDSWRQDRAQRFVSESLTLSLLSELEANQRTLEARLPYHEAMLDTFRARVDRTLERVKDPRSLSSTLRTPSLAELGFPDGIKTYPLTRNAWATTRASTAISQMEPGLVFVLSTAYTTQEEVGSTAERLREKLDGYVLAAIEGERPAFALVDFTSTLSDLVQWEQALCNSYQLLGRKLTGRNVNNENRCGSGNITIR